MIPNYTAFLIDESGFVHPLELQEGHKWGSESVFIRTSKTVGFKGFESKMEAERSLERQAKAHEHNIAPKVLSEVVEIVMPVGETPLSAHYSRKTCKVGYYKNKQRRLYGYKTQVATDIGTDTTEDEFNALYDKCKELDMCWCDLHDANIGRVGKKLVCIDFGDRSA